MSSSAGSSKDLGSEASSAPQQHRQYSNDAGDGAEDVLGGNRSVQDGIFTCMFLLTKGRGAVGLRLAALKTAIEACSLFLVLFNLTGGWAIAQDLWIWKTVSWLLFRIPVSADQGYDSYILLLYIILAVVLLFAGLTVWMAVLLRKDEQASRDWKRLISCLQFTGDWLCGVCYVALVDYLVNMFNCNWAAVLNATMTLYPGVQCVAIPHVLHMASALIAITVFVTATLLLSVGACDPNPASRGYLVTPHAVHRLKTMVLKIILISAASFGAVPSVQAPIAMLAAAYITYLKIMTMPYLWAWVNHVWIGIWLGLTYTATCWVVLRQAPAAGTPDFASYITANVLYGVFPVVLGGAFLSHCKLAWDMRPLRRFLAVPPGFPPTRSKELYRFRSKEQVELLSRVMRRWDLDGVLEPEAVAAGELIIKCGLFQFPTSAYILTLYANFLIEVRKDVQKCRTHIQLCSKHHPTLVEQYFIFASEDLTKNLRSEGGETGAMDLLQFLEYQRMYRSVVRAHKTALFAQRRFWSELVKTDVKLEQLEEALRYTEAAERGAALQYRRVLERYPKSGKLLRAYGKFLEDVQNDPYGATKYYTDAMKVGLEESLVSLVHAGENDNTDNSSRHMFIRTLDDKNDGVIVITAQGTIMMVNQVAYDMFGYDKGELEGKNVSCLMPAPFSQNHNTYLANYLAGAPGVMVEQLRETVALSKSREVWPVNLGVTHMVGEGAESIYMGIVRPFKPRQDVIKMWVLPRLCTVLCAEQRFSDWFGKPAAELVGAPFAGLGTDGAALYHLIMQAADLRTAAEGGAGDSDSYVRQSTLAMLNSLGERKGKDSGGVVQLEEGVVKLRTKLNHKYSDVVEVELRAMPAAPKMELYIEVEVRLAAPQSPLVVFDPKGRVCYANQDMAAMLEYPHKQLMGMDLTQLIPAPFAQLHREWLGHLGATRIAAMSCRTGQTVEFVNANGLPVPVKLSLSQREVGDQLQHVVRVARSSAEAALNDKRLVLTVGHGGVVDGVHDEQAALFGFPAGQLVGRNIAEIIDGFEGFVEKHGAEELTTLLGALVERSELQPGMSWRVGVQAPRNARGTQEETKKTAAFLLRRNRNQLKPAIMVLEVTGGNDGYSEGGEDAKLLLHLWRADLITGVLEVDHNLVVVKADFGAGLILGMSHLAVQRHMLSRFLDLPDGAEEADLMGKGPRGAMKGSKGLWKVGAIKELQGHHVDRAPLTLSVHAVSRTVKLSSRIIAKISMPKPTGGGKDAFESLAMGEPPTPSAAGPRGPAVPPTLAAPAESAAAACYSASGAVSSGLRAAPDLGLARKQTMLESEHSSSSSASGDSDASQLRAKGVVDKSSKSQKRTAEWLTRALAVPADAEEDDNIGRAESPPAVLDGRMRGDERGHGARGVRRGDSTNLSDDNDNGSVTMMEGKTPRDDALTLRADVADVDQAASSHGGDEPAKDDDVAADFRRAKRLRKLTALLISPAAQHSTRRFAIMTAVVLAAMLLCHVIVFVVFTQQLDAQHIYVLQTATLGSATDYANLLTSRANYAAKCQQPLWANINVCKGQVDGRLLQQAQVNAALLVEHRGLYLGSGGNPQPLQDKEVYDLWTYPGLVEEVYQDFSNGATIANYSVGLWQLGNQYVLASEEVVYNAKILGAALNTSTDFQFVRNNGPFSVSSGYSQSLDILVAFAWQHLDDLHVLVILLIVIEGIVVQLSGMAYEFLILQRSRAQYLRTFSLFLALPSGLLRQMASKPCQVDDDDKEDGDGTSQDGDDGPAAAADVDYDGAVVALKPVQKSVRMFVDSAPEAEAVPEKGKRQGLTSTPKQLMGSGGRKSITAGGVRRVLRHQLRHMFEFVMVKTIKMNGKRLVPNHAGLLWVMGPLVCWWVAIIAIYSVTFNQLSSVQQPLGQLNLAQRVLYMSSRIRNFANFAVFEETPESQQQWIDLLVPEIEENRLNYNLMLYGGYLPNPRLPNTYITSSTFASPELASIFFGTGQCFRFNQSKCYLPSSPYYTVTHSGLDAMFLQFFEEATLLAGDPFATNKPNSSRYTYISQVAGWDMYEGMQQACTVFSNNTVAKYDQVKVLHVILLVASIAILAAFLLVSYRPYVRRQYDCSRKVAAMLSQLPPDVDIETHIKGIIKREIEEREGTTERSAGDAKL